MPRQEQERRSNLVQILRPWTGVLSITQSEAELVVRVNIQNQEHKMEAIREAMILLALAVEVDPMAIHELAQTGWFRAHDDDDATPIDPSARLINASLHLHVDFDESMRLVPSLLRTSGHVQGRAQAVFDAAVRVLRALGRRRRHDPVVISIIVVLSDSGWMTPRDYSDCLPRFVRRLNHRATDIPGFQVDARVEITVKDAILSSELVMAMATVAQEQPMIRMASMDIDPYYVTCSKEEFAAFVSAAVPASCAVSLRLNNDDIHTDHVELMHGAPIVCSGLEHHKFLGVVEIGEMLQLSRDFSAWPPGGQSAWRVVLDSVMTLLSSTTVSSMDWRWGKIDKLNANERQCIRDWAASNASSAMLLSSQVRQVVMDANGVELVKELLQATERVGCEEIVHKCFSRRGDFEFISLAPSKFAALRVLGVKKSVVGATELAAIATLPCLEELSFYIVTLDRDQLVLFLESLMQPAGALPCRRRFHSLRLDYCMGEDHVYLPDDAMAELISSILKTNKFIQHLYLSVCKKTGAWAEVEAHTGDVVYASPLSPEVQEERCAFLSVVAHANAGIAVARLDTFLVRKIFSWSDLHAIRGVWIRDAL